MKEYELLRNEMMESYRAITQYNTVLYTATATILALVLQRDEYLLCLIPYIVIIPLFLLCESKRNGICRIAAYMNVFLEGDEFNWERRHHLFDQKKTRSRGSLHPYYFLMLTCTGFSIYKIICGEYSCTAMCIRIVAVLTLLIISLIVMKSKTVNYTKTRDELINDWREIKAQLTEK